MAAQLYIEYHMNRAHTPADDACLIDFRTDEAFFDATKTIRHFWTLHGGAAFAGVPVNVLAQLFKACKVVLPAGVELSRPNGYGLLEVCLHAHEFFQHALDRLHQLGAFTRGDGTTIAYTSMRTLVSACNGVDLLRPKRVEPITPAIVQRILDLALASHLAWAERI